MSKPQPAQTAASVNRRMSRKPVPAEPAPAVARGLLGRRAMLGSLVAAGLGAAAWRFWPKTAAAPALTVAVEASTEAPAVSTPKAILDRCVAELEAAEQKLAGINDMQTVFLKQEQLDGVLAELNKMELKVRKQPLAAYMKWQSQPAGREVLWVKDANDGMMLVQPGGLGALLVSSLKVDPLGDLALSSSRRPITEIGIWHMTSELLKHAREAQQAGGIEAAVDDVRTEDGRACRRYTFTGKLGDKSGRLVMFLDKELQVPLGNQVYENVDNELQLVESYMYVDLKLGVGLKDVDFDPANPAYKFKGK